MRPALVAGLAGTLVGVVVVLFALPSELFGRVPPVSGTLMAPAEHVAVIDGETLRLRESVIRLQGIATPPRGQGCGSGADCGAAAADALAALVRGREVTCRLNGRDRDGLPQGLCAADGTELNRALVAAGWARSREEASGFLGDELRARDGHLGLWRQGPF